ncbi:uncharacterized protein F5Z01DRAFT_750866 [Emericellopsis atlantica]|uniref:Uncharacterized protein n=1 Tax=Emericellopsis atlantica TaxID=2614577 RepID=A0A9P7ZKQ7_9HYPO|nr:uncharacterized protein F5Z01DRAFT_750866 [Emericellopsis atlantica]KAG9253899.1 hypothetical protein F5Z01DRAFT_750866 [Emericellopsis atlantica]
MRCKDSGPATIVEWFAGTSAASVARRKRRQARQQAVEARSLFRLEVTTDDEFGEDTVHVTYPRTGGGRRCASQPEPVAEPEPEPAPEAASDSAAEEATVKKVRFEQSEPRKSALKKTKQHTTTTTTTTVTTESSEAESESQSESVAGESSAQGSSEESEPVKPAKKVKKSRKAKAAEKDNTSESEACDCEVCTNKRRKARKASKGKKQPDTSDSEASSGSKGKKSKKKKKKKKTETPETSESEAEILPKSKKVGKKAKKVKKVEEPDSGDETETTTGEETEEEPESPPKKKKTKAKQKKKSDQQAKPQKDAEKSSGQPEPNSSKRRDERASNYPEANSRPAPNPRRPHYIEPIRAETVQTEKVLEGPEDPRPNAYYDPQHNVLRVYHGPVWGSRGEQALYPERDQSVRPPPVGVPHPLHNPYEYGFRGNPYDHHPPYGLSSEERYGRHAPLYGPPPNLYNDRRQGPYHNPAMPGGYPPFERRPSGMNKGAFADMAGANGPGNSPAKTKSATNNVGPGSVKVRTVPGCAPDVHANGKQEGQGDKNSYYKAAKSKFATWSGRQSSNASHKSNNTNNNKAADGWGQPADNNSNKGETAWPETNDAAANDTAWTTNDAADNTAWNTNDNQPSNGAEGEKGNDDWGTTQNAAGGSAWGSNAQNSAAGQEENNIGPGATNMPGSWDDTNADATAPPWGDVTAAANTGGLADKEEVSNVLPSGGW